MDTAIIAIISFLLRANPAPNARPSIAKPPNAKPLADVVKS